MNDNEDSDMGGVDDLPMWSKAGPPGKGCWTIAVYNESVGTTTKYFVHATFLRKSNYFVGAIESRMSEATDQTARVKFGGPAANAFPLFLDYVHGKEQAMRKTLRAYNDEMKLHHFSGLQELADYFDVANLQEHVAACWSDCTNVSNMAMFYEAATMRNMNGVVDRVAQLFADRLKRQGWPCGCDTMLDVIKDPHFLLTAIRAAQKGKPSTGPAATHFSHGSSRLVAAYVDCCQRHNRPLSSETFRHMTTEELLPSICPDTAIPFMDAEDAVAKGSASTSNTTAARNTISDLKRRCLKSLVQRVEVDTYGARVLLPRPPLSILGALARTQSLDIVYEFVDVSLKEVENTLRGPYAMDQLVLGAQLPIIRGIFDSFRTSILPRIHKMAQDEERLSALNGKVRQVQILEKTLAETKKTLSVEKAKRVEAESRLLSIERQSVLTEPAHANDDPLTRTELTQDQRRGSRNADNANQDKEDGADEDNEEDTTPPAAKRPRRRVQAAMSGSGEEDSEDEKIAMRDGAASSAPDGDDHGSNDHDSDSDDCDDENDSDYEDTTASQPRAKRRCLTRRAHSNTANAIATKTLSASCVGTSSRNLRSRKKNKAIGNEASAIESYEEDEDCDDDECDGKAKTRHMSFEERLEQLKAFKEKHGHCRVPFRRKGFGTWVSKNRALWRQGKLSTKRINQLENIGMVWSINAPDRSWDEWIQLLKEYKEKHDGDCRVPQHHPNGLGNWVNNMRHKKKKGTISRERLNQLKKIGMVWSCRRSWDDWIQLLEQYKETNGHCNVPVVDEFKGAQLGYWVRKTRSRCKRHDKAITPERIAQLDEMGFVWKPPSRWG